MKKVTICLIVVVILLNAFQVIYGQTATYKEGPYTLTFINKDSTFDAELGKKLVSAFFEVYPKEVDRFNPDAVKEVTFVIDPEYDGVANTDSGKTTFSSGWFKKKPGDIDVVTHEVMHIVQAYPPNSEPWWVMEGLADYARFMYGVANDEGGWALPDVTEKQKYTDGYRVSARFLYWLETHIRPTINEELDDLMRSQTLTDKSWVKLTGNTVDELWEKYTQNPAIKIDKIVK